MLKNFLQNYFNFSGRATRREFWSMVLFLVVFYIICVLFHMMMGPAPKWPTGIYRLDVMIMVMQIAMWCLTSLPMLVGIIGMVPLMSRRIHDAGFSEWVLFMPAVCVFLVAWGINVPELVLTLACAAIGLWGLVLALMPSRARRKK